MRRFAVLLALTACNADIGEPSGPIIIQDAGTEAEAAAAPATNRGLGVVCSVGSECESGLCFVGGQASYCSLRCTSANATTICTPPVFDGLCNMQGYCRRP